MWHEVDLCFPYACFHRKRAFSEMLCSDILFWFLTEVVKATDLWHKQFLKRKLEQWVRCSAAFKRPPRFSSLFSSNIFQLQKMKATVFALKANLDPSLTESLSILDKSYMTSTVCLDCCNEASSMVPLTWTLWQIPIISPEPHQHTNTLY